MSGTALYLGEAMAFAGLSIAFVLTAIRLYRGPHLADRVVALDLLATLMIGYVAIFSIASNDTSILGAALVLALVAFLSTLALALYIERGSR